MKIFFKLAAFSLALLALAFAFETHAAIQQTDDSNYSTNFNTRWQQMLGTNLLGTITDILVKVGRPGQAGGSIRGTVEVKLCEWDTAGDAEGFNDCSGANEVVVGSWTNTTNDIVIGDAELNYTGLPYSLNPAKYYMLFVRGISNGGITMYGSGSDTAWRTSYENVNTAGFAITVDSATGYDPSGSEPSLVAGTDTNVHDLYFSLPGGIEGVGASIEFNNPVQGQVLNGWPSHLNFDISTNYAFCGYVTGIVEGEQGGTEGSCFPVGTTEYNYYTPGTPSTGTIQANIAIDDGNGGLIATSTITFQALTTTIVPTGEGIGPTYPSSINPNATSSAFYVDCSAYSVSLFSSSTLQGIGCIAKKTALDVMAVLFIPSQNTLNAYSSLTIEDKFPFAYWYDLKSSFESVNSSSTGAFPSLSLQLFPSSTLAWATTATFSSTTVSSYLGSTMISLFRTLIQAALWLAFAYFVYRKLKAIFDHDNTTA